ncbi:carbohydrate ABC transporter membrane protein 1, CUT1 family [Micromonospora coxensis]|uniref:Carbohydrate ABC transporter membrane protein 1, CUT1 family n=1 Tax=Micromonospora coxensis TaxID=356852 RepID=A0A1C5K1X6_9ACTN|nr:carbohydrate ABC transporter membrane protein 1, CUT1 family [Micromonospora coxensis]
MTPHATTGRADSPVTPGGAARPGAGTGPGPAARRARRRATTVNPGLYLFPLPAVALLVVFFAVPTVQAVQYAVTDWDGFSADYRMVGADNFTRALTGDDLFRNALVNNLKFMLVVVLAQTALSLLLAVLLARNSRGSVILRSLYFFPTILSSVSVAFIWKFVYDPNFGLVNRSLDAVGLGGMRSSFLGDDQAIYWVAITQVWFHAGQMMVVFVAGLQAIPVELYEAAGIDGAGRWGKFRHITWPMIAPATAIVVAYTTIQSFKAFDLILGLGGNPPNSSLDILSTRIYTTFANSDYGYAAAESLLFMILIGIVTVTQRRMLRATTADT